MTGIVATAEPGVDQTRSHAPSRHGLARLVVRPAGSLIAMGLAMVASALPLTGKGLGSATASAAALGLAWDSTRTDLRLAAFAGALVLMLAVPLTVVSVLPGTFLRRAWISVAALFVLAMGTVVIALGSNAGSAVTSLGMGAVVLCATIVIDMVLNLREQRTMEEGS